MVSIVTHGGAGTINGKERRELSASGTDAAAELGYKILKNGGSAIEATKEAVRLMEDLPQFNAGYGSVITSERKIEMDAMIVDGHTGNIGGVMTVSRIKNPIILSELIMKNSKHILFSGEGAEKFAISQGIELIDPETLITDRVLERFANWQKKNELDQVDPEGRDKYGTVGAVAIDDNGRLAAATSTGGVLGKTPGRVGDTPMFGAGTYADERFALSATGVGEYIIQGMVGMRIRHLIEELSLSEATQKALQDIKQRFGKLGVICLDSEGNWEAAKTTKDLAFSYKSDTEELNFLP